MGSSRKKDVSKKRTSTASIKYNRQCQKNLSKAPLLHATELPEIFIHSEPSRRELCDEKHKEIPKDTTKLTHNLKSSSNNVLIHASNVSRSSVRFKGVYKTIPESIQNCRATNKRDSLRKLSGALRSKCQIETVTSLAGQTQTSSHRHFMPDTQRSDPRRNKDTPTSKTKHSTRKCSYLRSLINLESCDDKVVSFKDVVNNNHRSTRRIELSKSSPNQYKPSLDHPCRFYNNMNKSNSRNSDRSKRKRMSRNNYIKERKVTLREFFDQRINHYQQRVCKRHVDKNSPLHANNSNTFNLYGDIVEMDKENRNERLSSSKAGIFCRNISTGLRQIASNIFGNEKIGNTFERETNSNLKFCESLENPVARGSKMSFNRVSTNSFQSIKHGFSQVNLTTSGSRPDNTAKTHLKKDSSLSSNANVSGFSGEENQSLPNVDRSSPLTSDGEETTKHETDANSAMCLKASEGHHDCRLVKVIHEKITSTDSSSSGDEGLKKNTKWKPASKSKNHPTTSHNGNVSDSDAPSSDEATPTKTLTKQTKFPSETIETQRGSTSKSAQPKKECLKVSKSKEKLNINETKTPQNEILEQSKAQELSHGQKITEAIPKKIPERQKAFHESHNKSWVPRPVETMPRRLQGRMSPPGESYCTVRSILPRPPETMPKKLWDVRARTLDDETEIPSEIFEKEKLVDLTEVKLNKQTQFPSEVFETEKSSPMTVKPILRSIEAMPKRQPSKTFSPRDSLSLIKNSLTPKSPGKKLMAEAKLSSVKRTLPSKLDSSTKVKPVDPTEVTQDKQTQFPSEEFEADQPTTAKPNLKSIETTPKTQPGKMFIPRDSFMIKKSLTPKLPGKKLMTETKISSAKWTLFPSKLDSSTKVESSLPRPVETSAKNGGLVDPESKAPPKSELPQDKPSSRKCLSKTQEGTPLSEMEKPKQMSTEVFAKRSDKGDRSVHFECSFHNLESRDDPRQGQNRNILGCSSFHCKRKNGIDSKSYEKSDVGREFYRFNKNDKENEVIIKILSKQVAEILKGQIGEDETPNAEATNVKLTNTSPKKHEHKHSGTTGLGGHPNLQENKNEKGDGSLDYQRIIRKVRIKIL